MYAESGDRIIVKGHHVGEPSRDCRVIAVRGPDGQPPYVVRWEDSDHDTLYYPGPDATVHRFAHGT